MTHREFAGTNEIFKKACELAKLKPTVRQASKFRLRRGSAYAFKKQAIETVEVNPNPKGDKKNE